MVIARKPFENRQMRRLSVILLFVSLLLLILETFLLINLIIYAVKLEYKALLIIAGSLVLFCLIFTVVLILSSVFSIGKIQLQLLFGTAFVVILHLAILALIISWGIKSDQEFRGRVDRWNNSTNSMIENTTISTTTTSTTSTPATTTNILLNDTNGMIDHKIPFYFFGDRFGHLRSSGRHFNGRHLRLGDPGFSTTTRKSQLNNPINFPILH
ncbi:unnamed protein product, partial [Mesorhabditis belari]|uniref:Uncharacterized protein n=1 Tax=Mesorhabditis belari TaxID=2138241 RepID=A0AAF3FJF0_9BILA